MPECERCEGGGEVPDLESTDRPMVRCPDCHGTGAAETERCPGGGGLPGDTRQYGGDKFRGFCPGCLAWHPLNFYDSGPQLTHHLRTSDSEVGS